MCVTTGGAIAGIVIAIIAVIAVTVVAIVIFIKFHPRRKPGKCMSEFLIVLYVYIMFIDTGVRLNDIAQGEEGMAGGTQRDIKDQEDDKLKQQENSVNHTPEEIGTNTQKNIRMMYYSILAISRHSKSSG